MGKGVYDERKDEEREEVVYRVRGRMGWERVEKGEMTRERGGAQE